MPTRRDPDVDARPELDVEENTRFREVSYA